MDVLSDLIDPGELPNCVGGLQEDEVHLWTIHTESVRYRMAGLESLLSREERIRSRQFRFGRDRDLFVTGRIVTRLLLASYAGVDAETVRIEPDDYGKPRSNAGFRFNISHSNDHLLLGFSSGPIGIDIERIDSRIDLKRLAERHFTDSELEQILRHTPSKQVEAFFGIWTRKEAVVKGVGKGLGIPFRDFSVTDRGRSVQWIRPGGQQYGRWYVHEIDAPKGYAAAVATRQEMARFRHFILEG